MEYRPLEIEKKWQQFWDENGLFRVAHVYKGTPADNPHSKLEVNEYILVLHDIWH